ncbi:MAG TPA: DUF2330 domain-containing protein [Phycisphaerae bacterium]
MRRNTVRAATFVGRVSLAAVIAIVGSANDARACGGFFCQQVPINQAGEQIIFRQDGDMVTAVVLIQYVGTAEQFSWVVPAPGIPQVSLGSDLIFGPLDVATRPQFNLQYNGAPCIGFNPGGANQNASAPVNAVNANANSSGGVEILSQEAVGPFEVTVVSSDDPDALVAWLDTNGYVLTDRGRELIATYVAEECNFVAVRLQQDRGVGDIQPLIMRYQKPRPVVPIRLTAVAAQNDMGVLVWMLGSARAVPINYLHVDVNYTLLNWYSGSLAAYASYQSLVTFAMNQTGGQGFATDYAGDDLDVVSRLPNPAAYRSEIDRLRNLPLTSFYDQLYNNALFRRAKVLEVLRRRLPLPEGVQEFVYSSYALLSQIFADETLAAARVLILDDLTNDVVVPLESTLTVFDGMPYLTRLYTTLSADEMTLDPEFSFNPDLPGQALERQATLHQSCVNNQTQWALELGAGTGREGEVVIQGYGFPPFSAPPVNQLAFLQSARVGESGPPQIVQVNTFDVAIVGTPPPGTGNANTSTPSANINSMPPSGNGGVTANENTTLPNGNGVRVTVNRSPAPLLFRLCGTDLAVAGTILLTLTAWVVSHRRRRIPSK